MNDYSSAYQKRLQRNHDAIVNLVANALVRDPSIEAYVHKDTTRYISRAVFFKGDTINEVAFHEVPYRWSGCGYTEHGKSCYTVDGKAIPFTVNDVITNFRPLSFESFVGKPIRTAQKYLKIHNYLINFKEHPAFLNYVIDKYE